jgi:transposase
MTIPGVGMIAAMELLLELQDVNRFQRADQLAAYVGLTPSQYSSADKSEWDALHA